MRILYEKKTRSDTLDISKTFDSMHGGKKEQILLVYGLLKEIVTAIMMFYSNTKVKVRSPDGDSDIFGGVVVV